MRGKEGSKRWLANASTPGQRAVRQAMDEASPPREDELARQRVWAAVQTPWTEAPTRLRWLRMTIGATAAGVTVAAVALLVGTRALDRPAPITKAPEVRPVAEPLPTTGTVPVSGGVAARHRLARGVDAELSARAALVPGDDEIPPEVKRGRVRFSVPHQAPGRRYSVRAGAYRVAVLGTEFDVSVEDAAVSVTVASGVVQIEDAATGRRIERLAPGETWSSGTPSDEPSPTPALARPRAAAPITADGARALAEARAARRGGDPRQALSVYQRLVKAGGPLAESALFEMATIEHEDLNDAGRALQTWQRYRDRYPNGVLRAEADLSVIEVLPRLGQEARALEEARGFLRRYPRSERRGEVARVAGDLARTRGDCRAALGLYETALASAPASTDADDAAFGRVACLALLRDPRAAEAARDYQARFPTGRHIGEAARLVR